jgi:[acyl-carrier-protein] S-malonyltransferase
MKKRIAFLFPGQGAQYIGMGKDFHREYPAARRLFEQADDYLKRSLSSLIFSGSESDLTATKNSQPAIFTTSLAILAVIEHLFPQIQPYAAAGLSLGEYTALTSLTYLAFEKGLSLVQHRGEFMHQACEDIPGAMAVVLGMSDDAVINLVREVDAPNDLWAANFNCPGQVVLSGTRRGIELGTHAALSSGAKRVLPLQVHGAFHSGLMKPAQEKLMPLIKAVEIQKPLALVVMNCTGTIAASEDEIRENLIQQVVRPVYWHKSIQSLVSAGIECFVEIGCSKTLAGMNKRIGIQVPTISIETVEDMHQLEEISL